MIRERLLTRNALPAVLLGVMAPFLATGQISGQSELPMGDAPYDSAYFAWEAGDYPQALSRLERLLAGANAARYRPAAALLTGELYATSELTRDGRSARWSPDGRFVAWETGTGAALTTHIVRLEPGGVRPVLIVPAARAVLGNSTVAYIQNGGIRVRNLATGAERVMDDLQPASLHYSPDGVLHCVCASDGAPQLFSLDAGRTAVTTGAGNKANPEWLADGSLMYGIDAQSFAIARAGATPAVIAGSGVTASADRSRITYVARDGARYRVVVAGADGAPLYEVSTSYPVTSPRLSSDGRKVVFQGMPREDWDLYVAEAPAQAGTPPSSVAPKRLTYDIQHDIMPRFIADGRVVTAGGEGRHRRSSLYDTQTGDRTRLFHNNTVRTAAPEYEWSVSPDGTHVLIVAERDGDTVSPERGVYAVDLTREVTTAEVLARVRAMRVAENDLRARGRAMFAPIAPAVTAAVAEVSKDRIFSYARDLFAFGSKYITQPGNARAIEYIAGKLRSWGYEPELQYFEVAGRTGGGPTRTANVIARLAGTMDQDATYVVSSHFDSVLAGAGADDNSSGTTALLETARVLSKRPQPRTIEFAFFTGEEAGLLGSREYVRRALAEKRKIIGALNNDMIGFANDQRLDNTIRYSNPGIRDLQHGAAIGFTNLITYDAKYYKSTDAQAYYDAYGDIVGGIGSYPILSSPHYHQAHDVLETINQQLVTEVARTTVASLMLLATAPSRPAGLAVEMRGSVAHVTWQQAPESDVRSYEIEWGPVGGPARGTHRITGRANTSIDIPSVPAGMEIRVRSVNAARMEAWDWARSITP